MTATYYRVHWADAPAFSAENAWSALWGAIRSKDGSQTQCRDCDGTGAAPWGDEPCEAKCDDGWEDCVPGYSCFASPEDLIDYFTRPGQEPDNDEQVVIFEGRQVATGFDGEPCAVPTSVTATLAWGEFVARHTGAAA